MSSRASDRDQNETFTLIDNTSDHDECTTTDDRDDALAGSGCCFRPGRLRVGEECGHFAGSCTRMVRIARVQTRRRRQRPSKNAPRACSWRFASRDRGSFKHLMSGLRLCKRVRVAATHATSLRRNSTQLSETGSGFRDLSRGGNSRPRAGRLPHPRSHWRRRDRVAQGCAGVSPSRKTRRWQPRRFPQSLLGDARCIPCGCAVPRPSLPVIKKAQRTQRVTR